jgi:diacylglycerol kinase family enzyme
MPTLLLINAMSGAVLSAGVDHCRALVAAHYPGLIEVAGTPFDLIGAANKAASDPAIDRVLLIGGDGTAAAVAGALAGTGKALAPLPGGTMNMLARDLGFSGDLETAIGELSAAHKSEIDIAYAAGVPFLNNVVFGTFSVAAESREAIRAAETLAETASATVDFVAAIAQSEPRNYVLEIDGVPEGVRTNTFMIAHNLYTGSEMLRPTRARLDDGLLGVYVATAEGPLDFLSIIYNAVSGQLAEAEGVSLRKCRRCIVASDHRVLNMTVDGEVLELTSPAEFTIAPKALTVLRFG